MSFNGGLKGRMVFWILCISLGSGLTLSLAVDSDNDGRRGRTEDSMPHLIVKVITADGDPVTNAVCRLKQVPEFSTLKISDARGIVEFGRIVDGPVTLTISNENSHPCDYFGEMTIPRLFDGSAEDEIVFVLKKYTQISGIVLTEEGYPVENMILGLGIALPGQERKPGGRAYTDKNGRFCFSYVKLLDGMIPYLWGHKGDRDEWGYYFENEQMEIGRENRVVAKKLAPLPPNVNCRLVDEDGRLIDVSGYFNAEGPTYIWKGITFGPTRNGLLKNGEFELQAYPAGRHTLTVHIRVDDNFKQIALREPVFELPCAGNALDFVVEREAEGIVQVLDADTKLPIHEAQVAIKQLGNMSAYKSNQDGVVSYTAYPLPFSVDVSCTGYLGSPPVKVQMPKKQIVVKMKKGEVVTGYGFEQTMKTLVELPENNKDSDSLDAEQNTPQNIELTDSEDLFSRRWLYGLLIIAGGILFWMVRKFLGRKK